MKNVHPSKFMPYTKAEIREYMLYCFDRKQNPNWDKNTLNACMRIYQHEHKLIPMEASLNPYLDVYGFRKGETNWFIENCKSIFKRKARGVIPQRILIYLNSRIKDHYVYQLEIYSDKGNLRRGLDKYYGKSNTKLIPNNSECRTKKEV